MDAVFDDIFGNTDEIVDHFDFDMDLLLANGSAASPPDDMLMTAIMENNILGLPEGGVELEEWEDKVDDTTPSSWEVPSQVLIRYEDNGEVDNVDTIMWNNLLGLPEVVDDTTPSSWEVPTQKTTKVDVTTTREGDKVVDVTASTTQGSTPYEMKWEGDKEKVLRQQVKLFIFQ